MSRLQDLLNKKRQDQETPIHDSNRSRADSAQDKITKERLADDSARLIKLLAIVLAIAYLVGRYFLDGDFWAGLAFTFLTWVVIRMVQEYLKTWSKHKTK